MILDYLFSVTGTDFQIENVRFNGLSLLEASGHLADIKEGPRVLLTKAVLEEGTMDSGNRQSRHFTRSQT